VRGAAKTLSGRIHSHPESLLNQITHHLLLGFSESARVVPLQVAQHALQQHLIVTHVSELERMDLAAALVQSAVLIHAYTSTPYDSLGSQHKLAAWGRRSSSRWTSVQAQRLC
jgi:hypothetical protein